MRSLLRLLPLPLLALASSAAAVAQETPSPAPSPTGVAVMRTEATAAAPRPTLLDGAILGLVEGVTEFLPVSSTGHLIIASNALGLESERPVVVPGSGETVPFKQATDAFIVMIQIGAIAAVAILYWKRVTRILAGLLGRDPGGLRLAINIVVACIPAGVLGLAAGDFIDEHLFSMPAVIAALFVGALLMFWVEWRRKKVAARAAGSHTSPSVPAGATGVTLDNLRPRQALLIGGMQCFALWPGTSRSMVTIVGGYMAGLPPVLAAEFSFLVGLPLLSAAALLKTYKHGDEVLAAFGSAPIAVGLVVAAVSAAIAVRFLVGFLNRHGLAAFAWYRIVLAVALVAYVMSSESL